MGRLAGWTTRQSYTPTTPLRPRLATRGEGRPPAKTGRLLRREVGSAGAQPWAAVEGRADTRMPNLQGAGGTAAEAEEAAAGGTAAGGAEESPSVRECREACRVPVFSAAAGGDRGGGCVRVR